MAEVKDSKEITVRLRVVGVFYDEMITVPIAGDVTIKDILDAAQVASGKTFRYRAESRYTVASGHVLSLTSFTHQIPELMPSLGNRKRDAGIYEIRETVDKVNENEIVHAWQFYVISNGKAVSNASNGDDPFDVSPAREFRQGKFPKSTPGFTAFDKQPVKNGDEIVWRNVSIARGPTRTDPIE